MAVYQLNKEDLEMSTYKGIIVVCKDCGKVQVCFRGLCAKCQDKKEDKAVADNMRSYWIHLADRAE